MRGLVYILITFLVSLILNACNNHELRMNGTKMPYYYQKQNYSKPPKGYEPFYMNFLGRHGSRNLISNKYLDNVLEVLSDARKKDCLTVEGEELMSQIELIKKHQGTRFGKLTELGKNQLKGIAQRMATNFPELFSDQIYAQTDSVERCIESMNVFFNELIQIVEVHDIKTEVLPPDNELLDFFKTNKKYVEYFEGNLWREFYDQFSDSVFHKDRSFSTLFRKQYLDTLSNKTLFFRSLFEVNAILPNTDIRISLQNFFTSLDLYNLWRVNNVREYLEKGPTPLNDGLNYFIATPLLKDFLSTANNAVQEGGVSGDFRFAHAETIIPFAALIGIPKASKEINNISKIQDEWLDFDIAPMAANIQWIFYSNSEGNVIVKMMLNEIEVDFPVKTDIHPYYYWDDVYIYYNNLLDKIENNG